MGAVDRGRLPARATTAMTGLRTVTWPMKGGILKPGLARGDESHCASPASNAKTRQAEGGEGKHHRERLKKAALKTMRDSKDDVSNLNQLVRDLHRELKFSVDDDSGETVVKVIDKETDEVVRQIPSAEVLRLRKRLEESRLA